MDIHKISCTFWTNKQMWEKLVMKGLKKLHKLHNIRSCIKLSDKTTWCKKLHKTTLYKKLRILHDTRSYTNYMIQAVQTTWYKLYKLHDTSCTNYMILAVQTTWYKKLHKLHDTRSCINFMIQEASQTTWYKKLPKLHDTKSCTNYLILEAAQTTWY